MSALIRGRKLANPALDAVRMRFGAVLLDATFVVVTELELGNAAQIAQELTVPLHRRG